jgi:hypothetical protein
MLPFPMSGVREKTFLHNWTRWNELLSIAGEGNNFWAELTFRVLYLASGRFQFRLCVVALIIFSNLLLFLCPFDSKVSVYNLCLSNYTLCLQSFETYQITTTTIIIVISCRIIIFCEGCWPVPSSKFNHLQLGSSCNGQDEMGRARSTNGWDEECV